MVIVFELGWKSGLAMVLRLLDWASVLIGNIRRLYGRASSIGVMFYSQDNIIGDIMKNVLELLLKHYN